MFDFLGDRSFAYTPPEQERVSLQSLEVITDALIELMEVSEGEERKVGEEVVIVGRGGCEDDGVLKVGVETEGRMATCLTIILFEKQNPAINLSKQSQGCLRELKDCQWRQHWTELARGFAFQYNPALQPRAIIVYGCISKVITDSEIKQLLKILVRVGG